MGPQLPEQVLDFWFDPPNHRHWFEASDAFDQEVRANLLGRYVDAAQGHLDHWCDLPNGALALCILFDQVPRNIFRGAVQSFATDAQARSVARLILARGFDHTYPTGDHRMFCYLPFEHSEDLDDQRLSVQLFSKRIGDAGYREYARMHLDIVMRFGRFPHRNAILGRVSTAEEVAFLHSPTSSF
jgi:uncharacterized protein (DUF924 family)